MEGFRELGLLLALAGSISLYFASPNQGWLRTSWPEKPARRAGALLLASSFASLCKAFQAVPAALVFAVWVMLILTLLPCIGALIAMSRTHP